MSDSLLARELRKRKPFELPEQEAYLNLIRTTDQLQIHFARLFRLHGITVQQYNILRILRGARPQAVKISEIADRMITRDPDVTRLVDRLIRQGLVRLERDTEDRRVVLVEITGAGLAMLARLDGPAGTYTEGAMAGLKQQQLKTLDTLLNEIRAGIRPVGG